MEVEEMEVMEAALAAGMARQFLAHQKVSAESRGTYTRTGRRGDSAFGLVFGEGSCL